MVNLYAKLGDMNFDGLFSGENPAALVDKRVIAKGDAETTYARGTLMEIDSDGKLHVLGTDTANTPDCILADEVTVGTAADETVVAYVAGCFNTGKLTVADNYTITAANLDALRIRNIILRDAADAN